MKQSINHPWAISEKYSSKYGDIWTNLDFEFNDNITTEQFKTDPMNVEVGTLKLANKSFNLKYKDLLMYAKLAEEASTNLYSITTDKNASSDIIIRGFNFNLKRHELGKLSTTLNDSVHVLARRYELGLYL